MTMATYILILVCAGLAALAFYYWAKCEFLKAELRDAWEPLDPPDLDLRNREKEQFWDYVSDRESMEWK